MEASSRILDPLQLVRLQQALPGDLELIRLRLRFALPPIIKISSWFSLQIEAVDEMGRPLPPNDCSLWIQWMRQHISITSAEEHQGLSSELRECASSTKNHAMLKYQCRLTTKEALKPTKLRLWIHLKPSNEAKSDAFHAQFECFCIGSRWFDAKTLVLSLVTSEFLLVHDENTVQAPFSTHSLSQRWFQLSDTILRINENFGDCMGAHCWDASILLAFVMNCHQASDLDGRVLELGAGCGLLTATLQHKNPQSEILATEKPECLALLRENLDQNPENKATAIPLLWATEFQKKDSIGIMDVVVAADVLYHWPVHEPFLETLRRHVDEKSQVILAHKHRSAATSECLEHVLKTGNCLSCEEQGSECPWSAWNVHRLAQLGRVDVLQLRYDATN